MLHSQRISAGQSILFWCLTICLLQVSAASSQIEATIGEHYPVRLSNGEIKYDSTGKPVANYALTQAIFMGCVFAGVIITSNVSRVGFFLGPDTLRFKFLSLIKQLLQRLSVRKREERISMLTWLPTLLRESQSVQMTLTLCVLKKAAIVAQAKDDSRTTRTLMKSTKSKLKKKKDPNISLFLLCFSFSHIFVCCKRYNSSVLH